MAKLYWPPVEEKDGKIVNKIFKYKVKTKAELMKDSMEIPLEENILDRNMDR